VESRYSSQPPSNALIALVKAGIAVNDKTPDRG
jgi:hypothetical protein